VISLPAPPKGPTAYVVTEPPESPQFRDLIAACAKALGAGSCDVVDIAIGPDAGAADRAALLQFLQDEYNALGAFIVGQTGAFYDDRSDGYDTVDETSHLLGEVGVIVRRPGELRAMAPRFAAAAATADALLPADTSELLILGADAHARAFAAAVGSGRTVARPAKITLSSTDAKELTEARQRLAAGTSNAPVEIRHVDNAGEHDRLLALMPPKCAIVNTNPVSTASPVGGAALFPAQSTVCDLAAPFGQSGFLSEAVRQRAGAELTLHDHATYRKQRALAIMRAMFGTDAGERQEAALLKVVDAHFAS
jgi:hypothetical protein